MAGSPLRAILVGCGGICGSWLPHILAHADLDLVALVDLNLENARSRAEQYGLGGTALESDLEESLARHAPVDLVFDCTVPAAHHAITCLALRHGSHVLGEKPLADTMENARDSVAAAQRAGRLYAVIQNRRYSAGVRRLRAFLEGGAIGAITTVCCDFFIGAHFGGFRDGMEHVLLLDMSIHHFDLARFLMGGAAARAVTCHEWNPPGSWYRHGAAAEAAFEMDGGGRFLYRGSWCAEGMPTSWQGSWRITGDHGTVLWDGEEGFQVQVVDGDDGFHRPVRTVEVPTRGSPEENGGHASIIREFVRAIRGGEVPETICTDNIKSLAMVFGAVESAERGMRVGIPA